jgi:hypothetical protein
VISSPDAHPPPYFCFPPPADVILPNWQQSLVTHPNHLDANEAPTRFDRPPVQQDQLDALNIFTDSMGHNFHDVPVGKARGSAEGEEV